MAIPDHEVILYRRRGMPQRSGCSWSQGPQVRGSVRSGTPGNRGTLPCALHDEAPSSSRLDVSALSTLFARQDRRGIRNLGSAVPSRGSRTGAARNPAGCRTRTAWAGSCRAGRAAPNHASCQPAAQYASAQNWLRNAGHARLSCSRPSPPRLRIAFLWSLPGAAASSSTPSPPLLRW